MLIACGNQTKPSESEYRSWENSIPILVKVLHRAGLDALTLVLEYQPPIGSRIDAVLLGGRRETGKPFALIFELKQWSAIAESARGTSPKAPRLPEKWKGPDPWGCKLFPISAVSEIKDHLNGPWRHGLHPNQKNYIRIWYHEFLAAYGLGMNRKSQKP